MDGKMKIFNKSILVCSILCAMFISCKTTEIVISNDASELEIIQTAQTAFDNGDKEGALKCYNKLLQLYGVNTATYVEGRYEIGHILLKEKKYEEAAERLRSLIRNDSKNYRPYIDLADCYLKLNRKQEAIDVLRDFQSFGLHNLAVNEMLEKLQMQA